MSLFDRLFRVAPRAKPGRDAPAAPSRLRSRPGADPQQEKGMHSEGPNRPRPSTNEHDRTTESAVLHRLLDIRPVKLSVAELIRELAGEEADFGTRDAIERAARELSGVGLIHLDGEYVAPTRAAIRFDELRDR